MLIKGSLVALLAAAVFASGAPTSGGRAQSGRSAPHDRTPQADRSAQTGRPAHADGIRFTIPRGWHAAATPLTPHLTNPHEVLTIGTGPLPVGGRCAQFPSAGLAALGATDALVTVQERLGSVTSFPPRPRRFSLPAPDTSEAAVCAGRPRAELVTYWLAFRDGGRGFHVLVAFGPHASDATRRAALAVLDSLRFPKRPPRLRLSYGQFECFGASWRVDFRDGGRAFTAHVYGPPPRRREALAILDPLRIRPAWL